MDRVYLMGKSRAATTNFRFLNMSSVISYLWPQTYGSAFLRDLRPYSIMSHVILSNLRPQTVSLFLSSSAGPWRCSQKQIRKCESLAKVKWNGGRQDVLLLIQNQRSSTEIILAPQINRGSNREDVLAREWLTRNVSFIWDKLKTPLKDIKINLDTRKDDLSRR